VTGPVAPQRLASLPILAGANPDDLAPAAARMWSRSAEPGEVLVREGEPGDTFWLLLEGAVSVTRSSPSGVQLLAEAPAGSILGELSVLRHQPRTATLTASEPSVLAVGDHETLELLLAVPAVRNRMRLIASSRLARDVSPVPTELSDGTPVLLHPLLPQDREGFLAMVSGMSADSLRRRFFSVGRPSDALIEYLIDIDYVDHFAWIVVDPADQATGLASARYVRAPGDEVAEAAFGTAEAHHSRGLGTLLMGALGVAAAEAGIGTLVAHVLDENTAMRAVFAKAHPKTVFDEPGVLQVTFSSEAAAAVLDPELRARLSETVHDIVTAASLALTAPHDP